MDTPHLTRPSLLRQSLVVTVAAVSVVLVAVLLWFLSQVLLLLFAGLLFAVFLSGAARILSRTTRLPRTWSLAVFLLAAIGCVGAVGVVLVPRVRNEAAGFREQIPRAVQRLQDFVDKNLPDGTPAAQGLKLTDLFGEGSELVQRFTGVFSTALGAIGSAAIVFFVGLFLALAPETYRAGVVILFPPAHRGRAREVLDRLGDTLWWWIVAMSGSMMVVGVLTGLGLYFLGVPLLFSLALLAALLTFIPNVGPVIAAVPAVLIGLLEGPRQAMWVALMYVGVQTVESYIITPLFQQRAISLPPALIIAAQVAMGLLGGAVGLLVATPLTAVAMVLVRELYLRDTLHEPLDDSA